MTPSAAPTAGEHCALAAALLQRAMGAFAVVPPDARGSLLAALDGFLARPGPATYLMATRTLVDARRVFTLRQVRSAQAGYAFARGLDTVRRELGAAAAETLAAVPADDRAGQRLRALALLAAAHRELAERVAGSAEMMRQKLGLSSEPPPPAPPVKPPRRRPAAVRRGAAARRRTSG
jgi:hypothetical protein